MDQVVAKIAEEQKKSKVVDVKSGDTVKVHQKIREGGKERIQIFEGLVIRTRRKNSLTSSFTVRRIASGVGVEKTFLIHSPNVLKVEVTKRSRVRRNYLSYMRALTGRGARLAGIDFDKDAVNVEDKAAEEAEAKIAEEQAEAYDPEAAKKAKQAAKAAAAAKDTSSDAEKLEAQPTEKPPAKTPAEEPNKDKP